MREERMKKGFLVAALVAALAATAAAFGGNSPDRTRSAAGPTGADQLAEALGRDESGSWCADHSDGRTVADHLDLLAGRDARQNVREVTRGLGGGHPGHATTVSE